jgi:small subunit ribosomal protein S3
MVTERKIVKDVVNRHLLKEYVMKATERAGFGGIDIQRNPMGTLVTLIAERPGMVIGHRGKTIKELTAAMEHKFNFDNPQIEVEEEKNPNLNANIMAHKLAVALERGWHFRRAGHSTVRKIMGSGARGCQVILAGKLTGERHRTEKFKEGHIKYCGETALLTMEIGYAVAKKKLGTIGIKCMIMRPGAVLPDEIKILSQEEAKGIVPEAVVEELKIDTTIQEEIEEPEIDLEADDDEAAEIVESLIEQSEREAAEKAKVAPTEPETPKDAEPKAPAKAEPKPKTTTKKAKAESEVVAAEVTEEKTEEPIKAESEVEPKIESVVEPEVVADEVAEKVEEPVAEEKPKKKAAPKKKTAPKKKAKAESEVVVADVTEEKVVESKEEEKPKKKAPAKKATTKKAAPKKTAAKKPTKKVAETAEEPKTEEKPEESKVEPEVEESK